MLCFFCLCLGVVWFGLVFLFGFWFVPFFLATGIKIIILIREGRKKKKLLSFHRVYSHWQALFCLSAPTYLHLRMNPFHTDVRTH